MLNRILLIFTCSLVLMSCKVSFPKQDYQPLTSLEELNGTYVNVGDSLALSLGLRWGDDINFISLEFKGDQLNLSYLADTEIVKHSYKGKLKNDYFEFYLEKKRTIAIVYNRIITDKVRIGKNANNQMFIQRAYASFGSAFVMMGGGNYNYTYTHNPDIIRETKVSLPFQIDGIWGYKNSSDSIIIEPKYDLVCLFEDSVARVKQGRKWALIDRKGKLITDFAYDEMGRYEERKLARRVYIDKKVGHLDKNGKELIPCVYDELSFSMNDSLLSITRIGNKYGYATSQKVIYPPMFDDASYWFLNFDKSKNKDIEYAKVKIGKGSYMIDLEGYAYRYKTDFLLIKTTILYETKTKVTDLIKRDED